MFPSWDKYPVCVSPGVTCPAFKGYSGFQKIEEQLVRGTVTGFNCPFPSPISADTSVCPPHLSGGTPNSLLSEVARAPKCGEPGWAAGTQPLEIHHLQRSQKQHGEARMLQTTIQVDNPFCVQKLPPILIQNQSLPFQKVLHMQNTISKFIFHFIVPSSLFLTDYPFPTF